MGRISRSDWNYLIKCLRDGSTQAGACASSGISETAFKEYRHRDENFRRRVVRAQGRPRVQVENALFVAATTPDSKGRFNEKAMELWLTNMYQDDWKKRTDLNISTDALAKVDEELEAAAAISPDQRARLLVLATQIVLGESPGPKDQVH